MRVGHGVSVERRAVALVQALCEGAPVADGRGAVPLAHALCWLVPLVLAQGVGQGEVLGKVLRVAAPALADARVEPAAAGDSVACWHALAAGVKEELVLGETDGAPEGVTVSEALARAEAEDREVAVGSEKGEVVEVAHCEGEVVGKAEGVSMPEREALYLGVSVASTLLLPLPLPEGLPLLLLHALAHSLALPVRLLLPLLLVTLLLVGLRLWDCAPVAECTADGVWPPEPEALLEEMGVGVEMDVAVGGSPLAVGEKEGNCQGVWETEGLPVKLAVTLGLGLGLMLRELLCVAALVPVTLAEAEEEEAREGDAEVQPEPVDAKDGVRPALPDAQLETVKAGVRLGAAVRLTVEVAEKVEDRVGIIAADTLPVALEVTLGLGLRRALRVALGEGALEPVMLAEAETEDAREAEAEVQEVPEEDGEAVPEVVRVGLPLRVMDAL